MSADRVIKAKASAKGTWTAHARRYHELVFFGYGREFLAASIKTGSRLVQAYLIGHAIEIFLKVLLLRAGMTTVVLRTKKYGHDISALVAECQSRSIKETARMSPELIADLNAFNAVYSSKGFEYFSILYLVAPPQLPDLRRIRRFAVTLERQLSDA